MKLDYRVNTTLDDQSIRQEVVALVDGKYERLSIQLMNLREQGVRDALIKLGWTPPAQTQADAPKRKIFSRADIKQFEVFRDPLNFGQCVRGITHCGRLVRADLLRIEQLNEWDAVHALLAKLNEEPA